MLGRKYSLNHFYLLCIEQTSFSISPSYPHFNTNIFAIGNPGVLSTDSDASEFKAEN